MGLYNMVWGTNPEANTILVAFNIHWPHRFRDAFLFERSGKALIEVLARQGGPNREVPDLAESNKDLSAHPRHVSDEDIGDGTYNIHTFDVTDFVEIEGLRKFYGEDESPIRERMTPEGWKKAADKFVEEKPEQAAALIRGITKGIEGGKVTILLDEDGPEVIEEDIKKEREGRKKG